VLDGNANATTIIFWIGLKRQQFGNHRSDHPTKLRVFLAVSGVYSGKMEK